MLFLRDGLIMVFPIVVVCLIGVSAPIVVCLVFLPLPGCATGWMSGGLQVFGDVADADDSLHESLCDV